MAEIDVDSLIEAYNQITARILEVTLTKKPNYDIDGQSVSWGTYLNQLTQTQKMLKEQIDANDDPFEIINEVYT